MILVICQIASNIIYNGKSSVRDDVLVILVSLTTAVINLNSKSQEAIYTRERFFLIKSFEVEEPVLI